MKTVFFGTSQFVLPLVEKLNEKFGLSFIVTSGNDSAVAKFARENEIPYLVTLKFDEKVLDALRNVDADLGVVADFGVILKPEVLDIFPRGMINLHPSLLPRYKGPTPVPSAILSGDLETGVTIIKMDEKMDHGPILAQEEYLMEDEDTTPDLLNVLFAIGAQLLDRTLVDYMEEVLVPIPQDSIGGSNTKLLSKDDGFIDFKNPPSMETVDRMIRAFYPWPGTWTKVKLSGKEAMLKLLPRNQVQVEGKKPMNYKDFKNGYIEGEEILRKLRLD